MEDNEDFFSYESRSRTIWGLFSPFFGIFAAPNSGIPLLHMSCVLNLENLATWCLRREYTFDLNETWGPWRETPLHLACSKRHETIINMLLDAGADPLATDLNYKNALYKAILLCDRNIVRKMAQQEPSKHWLKQEANDPHSQLLSDVAIRGNESVCRFLVEEYSFDIDITDELGFPPAMCALKGWQLDLVRIFVHEWKAHFNHWKDLHVCSKYPEDLLELITRVFNHYEVDINTTDYSEDIILLPIFDHMLGNDIPVLMDGLLELGLDIDRTNSRGQTILHRACLSVIFASSHYFIGVVGVVMSLGQLDINKTDQDGKTAIHCLISAQITLGTSDYKPSYVEHMPKSLVGLLDLGADRYIEDLDGRSALSYLQDTVKTFRLGAEHLNQNKEKYLLATKRMIKLLKKYQTVPQRGRSCMML